MFGAETFTGDEQIYRWIKLVVRDRAGNERVREVSYPVRVDERPTIDIVSPLNSALVVEQSLVEVNVNAFDDTGIDSIRLVATHNGSTLYEQVLKTAPFTYQFQMPSFNAADTSSNRVDISVEAIDIFGARFGDLDRHTATESLVLELIEDQAPTVQIALPETESMVLEGERVLVQVNAVDDIGIDNVVLTASGLIDGDRSFTDQRFPFEFLLEIPYGQAANDVVLTVIATEQRIIGEARQAQGPRPVILHVDQDVDAPEIVVQLPDVSGAAVAEKRSLPYQATATDNVAVTLFRTELYVDTNQDGSFSDNEQVKQNLQLSPPYAGSIGVETIDAYLGADDDTITQLLMQLRLIAEDGAGNKTVVNRPVILRRNAPPQVQAIQILDRRGYSLGSLTSITEGREIIASILASDTEVGVDTALCISLLVKLLLKTMTFH